MGGVRSATVVQQLWYSTLACKCFSSHLRERSDLVFCSYCKNVILNGCLPCQNFLSQLMSPLNPIVCNPQANDVWWCVLFSATPSFMCLRDDTTEWRKTYADTRLEQNEPTE